MKTEKRKTLQGSVLFTVVCVMALLIIFLTGTLALASASSNRAHKSYSSSQASYTARAAIESFTLAMEREPGLPAAIENMGNNPLYPQVIINDPSLGRVGCYDDSGDWHDNVIEIAPVESTEKQYIFTDANKDGKEEWVEVTAVRVTATCRVGKEEETVSAYIRKMPAGSSKTTPGGLEGLHEVGGNSFPNGGKIYGGFGLGIAKDNTGLYHLHNALEARTKIAFINGSLVHASSSAKFFVENPTDPDAAKPYSQTVIMGNLWMENNTFIFVDYDMKSNYTQKEIPYLYVDGAMVCESGTQLVVGNGDSAKNGPFNVFIGTVDTKAIKDTELKVGHCDLYLMDKYQEDEYYTVLHCDRKTSYQETADFEPEKYLSDWSKRPAKYQNIDSYARVKKGDNYFGSSGTSTLYAWESSVVNKSDSTNISEGGNIYCKGNLTLQNAHIYGDVRVEGDCTIKNGVTIDGDLVVGGTLNIYDGGGRAEHRGQISDWGSVYCDNVIGEGATREDDVLQDGFEEHLDEVQPGYTPIHNFVYDNTPLPEEMYEYRHSFKTNETGWRTHIKYPGDDDLGTDLGWDDEKTDGIRNADYAIYAIADEYLDKVDCVGKKYGFEPPYYVTSAEGFDTSRVTFSSQTIYKADPNDPGLPYVDETGNYVQVDDEYSYYKVDDEGNILNEVSKDTATRTYYTKVGDSKIYSKAEAYGRAVLLNSKSVRDYPKGEVYPSNMTREKIYGEDTDLGFKAATGETKIIKNLGEMRKDLNMNEATGEYKKEIYHTCVPKEYCLNAKDDADTEENKLPYAFNADGSKDLTSGVWNKAGDTIIKSCIIGYDKDAKDESGNPKVFTILDKSNIKIESSNNVWVVLRNVYMKEDSQIICNTNKGGKVCFLIDGTLAIRKGMIRPNTFTNGCDVDCKTQWGIEYYGVPSSSIQCEVNATLVGTFMCPETTFSSEVAGYWPCNYTDEYGHTTSIASPIVGSALFGKINSASNDFAVLNSGGNSASDDKVVVNTVFGTYQIDYFMGV